MNVSLVLTAVQYGAVAANHTEITGLIKDGEGKVKGAKMRDVLTGREWETKSKVRFPSFPSLLSSRSRGRDG
jgi:glycerol-3-phosphate dehydrogenase